jgi:hypothetical protein
MIEDLMFLFKALGDTLFVLTLAAYMLYGMVWLASLTVPHHRARFDETWIEKTVKEVVAWRRAQHNKTVKR